MQCVLAAFATFSTRTVRTGCQATSSRVQRRGPHGQVFVRGVERQGVHLLGKVCGHAVLPGSAYEFAARSLPSSPWQKSGALKKHPSGAKTNVCFVAFTERLKSCPFK